MKKKEKENPRTEIRRRITLADTASVEMEERKSIFIGHAAPVKDEEDARRFLEEKRREYHDATHNVYAYLLNSGAVARYSDDGEPQGTAGIPVLNVIKQSGATDLCVVVTRYFGGILLGAGGLVRAYGAAAKYAVDAAGLAVFEPYAVYRLDVSYSDYQKLTAALPKLGVSEDRCEFGECVTVWCAVEEDRADTLLASVGEITCGRGKVSLVRIEERASKRA
jgi:uncharacterized YigZ family protein